MTRGVGYRRRDKLVRRLGSALAASALLLPGSGIASAALPSCGSGRTMAASAQVRVFGFDRDPHDSVAFENSYRAYACYTPSRKVRRLGSFSRSNPVPVGTFGVYDFVVNGRFVAYDEVFCDRDAACRGPGIQVLDARTGRKRSSARTPSRRELITGLVLARDGSVAWVRPRIDTQVDVMKLDPSGEVLLDSGTDIDRDSLALGSHTVYWTRAGVPRSAPIG
jgi:hypothetical protein